MWALEYLEIVKLLLKEGADVNVVNHIDLTPLMIAAWRGHTEVLKLLLEAGANRLVA